MGTPAGLAAGDIPWGIIMASLTVITPCRRPELQQVTGQLKGHAVPARHALASELDPAVAHAHHFGARSRLSAWELLRSASSNMRPQKASRSSEG